MIVIDVNLVGPDMEIDNKEMFFSVVSRLANLVKEGGALPTSGSTWLLELQREAIAANVVALGRGTTTTTAASWTR